METASPAGLDRIKTGSNLRSVLGDVARLRQQDEYWHIRVRRVQVLWARLLTRSHAQALVRKVDEARTLYRRGRRAPLAVESASYTNLYDLDLIGGHWLVSRVLALDDATAARLAAAPPAGAGTVQPSATRPAATATPVHTPTAPAATATPARSPTAPAATATPTRPAITATPAAASATPAVPRVTASATAPAQVTGAGADPVRAVRAFYAALTARRFNTAYGLFTPRLKAQIPNRAAWAALFAQESTLTVTQARVVARNGNSATVALTLDTTWTAGARHRRFVGTWTLLREPRGWRLDSPAWHRVYG